MSAPPCTEFTETSTTTLTESPAPSSWSGTRAKPRAISYDLFSSSALALLDQAVVSGANFTIAVLVGRLCGLAELGAFALGGTILVFAAAVQEALIASPYTVFVQRLDGRTRGLYARSVLQQSGLLMCSIAIAWR